MAQPLFEVTESALIQAIGTFATQRALKGKGLAETAAKVMRLWVTEAVENIPPGDRGKVESYLMKEVTTYRRTVEAEKNTKKAIRQAELANKFRHTIAARIVGALNIGNARGKPAGEYYQKVNAWVQKRIFAVNLHRAGLIPARKVLRVRDAKGNPPKIKTAPGGISESLHDGIVEILVENWASSQKTETNRTPKGIVGLAGNAFDSGLEAMNRTLTAWVLEDVTKAAQKSGFST